MKGKSRFSYLWLKEDNLIHPSIHPSNQLFVIHPWLNQLLWWCVNAKLSHPKQGWDGFLLHWLAPRSVPIERGKAGMEDFIEAVGRESHSSTIYPLYFIQPWLNAFFGDESMLPPPKEGWDGFLLHWLVPISVPIEREKAGMKFFFEVVYNWRKRVSFIHHLSTIFHPTTVERLPRWWVNAISS